MKKRRFAALFLVFCMLAPVLGGCGGKETDTKVILYTGFKKDEVFRIETMSCMLPEVMVYLTNTQDQYENAFGSQIWQTNLGDVSLEDNIKETVLAQLAQIKTMNLLAQRHGVQLDEEELALTEEAADTYYSSLNQTEREVMQVDREVIARLYAEFALANKVYEYIIKDINPEISDDEARTITVQHILIRTYVQDGTGKKIEFSDKDKKEAYERAAEILALAREEGADFEDLVLNYSEGDKGNYSFGKGETDPAFEEAAFNLGKGEISDIIETRYGYHIIKCINTFNREETDANKIKIVEKRKEEVFGQEYDAFVSTLTRTINQSLWDSISFSVNEEVTTCDFFDIYNQYFS